MATEQPTQTYRGNCHCGAFVYEAELPVIKSALTCSCSMCHKKGTRLVFTPQDKVKFVKGDESVLTAYQFNSKKLTHMFCTNCGSPVLGKGETGGVATYALNSYSIDGASVGGERVVPTYTGPEPTVEIEGAKIYHGSCHCGAVTIAVKSKDFHKDPDATSEKGLFSCGCSICARNGNVWAYLRHEQVVVQGRDNLTQYTFNTKLVSKPFCKICGVNVLCDWLEVSQEHLAQLPEEAKVFVERNKHLTPVNLRALDNFSLDGLEINYTPGSHGRPYVNP
ncbi:hypothetical protein jhhlp_002863 [Lomentospora prolificans]|uniref:CENP-V/GFA domain-containing protein n=1 Tax=Lomentospora prolificans TaxID=41688 RepID=A0A2N3NFF6_9PEZI|nr:hypothetical protein jhhlp_002863 [Lomentospora prolificans]